MKLAIAVPTYSALKRLVNDFISSYGDHMNEVFDGHEYVLCLLAQDYSDDSRRMILDKLERYPGINFKVSFVDKYPHPISLFTIRRDCSSLCPDADAYLMADDDFVFKSRSREKYSACLDYLEAHPQCGVVQCSGYLGGTKQGDAILPTWGKYPWTDRGLLFRNLGAIDDRFDGHILKSFLGKPGRFEEYCMVLALWSSGYYLANQMNNPTLHRHVKGLPDAVAKRSEGLSALPVEENPKLGDMIETARIIRAITGCTIDPHVVHVDDYIKGLSVHLRSNPDRLLRLYLKAAIQRFGSSGLIGSYVKGLDFTYEASRVR